MIYRVVFAAILLIVLAGCSGTEPPTAPAPQAPISVTVQPLPSTSANLATTAVATPTGTASISGQVVSTTDQQPIRNTVIFLAQVYKDANTGQEAFALDLANSPASFTNEDGTFQFNGVVPGRYVLSIGDFYGVKDIVREANGDARVYTLENDQLVDAAVVQVRPDVSPGQ